MRNGTTMVLAAVLTSAGCVLPTFSERRAVEAPDPRVTPPAPCEVTWTPEPPGWTLDPEVDVAVRVEHPSLGDALHVAFAVYRTHRDRIGKAERQTFEWGRASPNSWRLRWTMDPRTNCVACVQCLSGEIPFHSECSEPWLLDTFEQKSRAGTKSLHRTPDGRWEVVHTTLDGREVRTQP